MRIGHALVCGTLGLVLLGCEEPTQIVPTTPPGGAINQIPESEKGDNGPQAIGEVAAAREKPAAESVPPARPTAKGEMITTPTGLKYETLQEGTGDEVKSGQTVVVGYVGKLDNGKVFDQSKPDRPFEVAIGTGQVIPGWDQGIIGMHVGERRKLIIPPKLGYGDRGQGDIPPNSTLTFEVEVLKVK